MAEQSLASLVPEKRAKALPAVRAGILKRRGLRVKAVGVCQALVTGAARRAHTYSSSSGRAIMGLAQLTIELYA